MIKSYLWHFVRDVTLSSLPNKGGSRPASRSDLHISCVSKAQTTSCMQVCGFSSALDFVGSQMQEIISMPRYRVARSSPSRLSDQSASHHTYRVSAITIDSRNPRHQLPKTQHPCALVSGNAVSQLQKMAGLQQFMVQVNPKVNA